MRRIVSSAIVVAVLLLPFAAFAQALKVGLPLPYTGVVAVIGQDLTRGIELYLEKTGARAGGRELQLVKEDTEGKPDVSVTKVRKMVERDRVDVLVGPVNGNEALAIREYVHGQGIPLIVPVPGAPNLTAPPMASPWIFRITDTSDMAGVTFGAWMLKKTPHRKVVVLAADFVAGHQSADAFMAAFRAGGGRIAKAVYAPLNTADFGPYLPQVTSANADAAFVFLVGADAIRFVKAYKEYGLMGKLPLFAHNALVDDVLLPAIGDAALGIVSVGHYSATLDTPESKAFVKEYEAKYKVPPTRYSEQGYVAAQLIGAAATTLKGNVADRAAFRDAIRQAASQIRPPRGQMRFDRYQQVIHPIYIMKVERQGGRLVNAIVEKIPDVSQEATWKWWNK